MTRFWDGRTDRQTDRQTDCTPRPAFAFGDAGKNRGLVNTKKFLPFLKGLRVEERPKFSSISMIIVMSKFNCGLFQWVRYVYNFSGSIRLALLITEPLK